MPAAGPSLDFEGFPNLADIEVAANAYVTGQKLCVFELLPHVCTKCPSRVREFFVGIGLGRGQRLLYSRRRCTSSNTEHHELAAAEGSC